MAARTIPFPNPPGNAATRSRFIPHPPPPPTGAAKLNTAPRRYRGLYLVPRNHLPQVPPELNRLAQTQAIVAQVEREIAEREIARRAIRDHQPNELLLLSPVHRAERSLTSRAAHRVVMSLFPAGL